MLRRICEIADFLKSAIKFCRFLEIDDHIFKFMLWATTLLISRNNGQIADIHEIENFSNSA